MNPNLSAPDAERALLGAAMQYGADDPVFREVRAEDFHDGQHRLVWGAIVSLAVEGTDPTAPTVVSRTKERGADLGKLIYRLDAEHGFEAPSYHAAVVRDRALRRMLATAGQDVGERASDLKVPLAELVDYAERRVFGVADSRNQGDGPVAVRHRLMGVVEMIQAGGYKGVPSGFADVDKMLTGGGFLRGQLVVVAGASSMGKTAFSTGLALNVGAGANEPVGYFSIEMTKDDNAFRMVCHEGLVSLKDVSGGGASDDDIRKVAHAAGILNTAPIYLDDTAVTVEQVRSAARRLKAEHGLRLIVVDHIQDMEAPSESRREQLGHIARGLKQLAKELDITVVAVSQLSRSVENRTPPKPRLSDLKESGDIENSADIVMMLYRPEYYFGPDHEGKDIRGRAELIFAKQRNGPTGLVPLTFLDYCARFDNYTGERKEWAA